MTEQQQADALARWLARGADGPPPEGLDREVVEGLYALRPDLAPRARVTADDILAGMTAGPFADGDDAQGNVVAFPVPASRPDGDADSEPAPVRPRPWWMAPAVGISLAAAAAAVLVVVPRSPAPLSEEPAQEIAPAADAAPPPPSRGASAEADIAPAKAAPAEAAKAAPPAPKQATPAARPTESRARASRADAAPPAPVASKPAPATTANDGALRGVAQGFGGLAYDDAAAVGAAPVAAERRAAPVAASIDEALDVAEEAEPAAAPARAETPPSAIPEVDDLPPAVRRALDDAAVLAATDPADAAASLLPRIAAPARVGQRVALAALDHAAASGDVALQRRIVDRGVALDPTSPTAATLRARRP